ncbi:hypothetical protein D9756_001453 [Leucocoprinus leucothites]|uniref:CCHC-type domain-containing protein n=1 Tax=Leucocoprinus leucothites TaxID=201217 RepID=A0A8H5G4A3_9AGAR|nr:hypothetical protein D9756_001453 [Leucoagaricus leucothites]
MNTDTVKILTVGSAVGSIQDLLAKIKAIDAKHGKFDLVLCIGDFFGPTREEVEGGDDNNDEVSMLLSGKMEVAVECYIMQGAYPLPQQVIQKFAKTGGELCKNVFLLGKSGLITTANGLRIACLGGIYDADVYTSADAPPGFVSPYFSSHTKERLLANTLSTTSTNKNYQSLAAIQSTSTSTQGIDILLSNTWPSLITAHSSCPVPQNQLTTLLAQPLDDIIRRTQPRYHFAMGGGGTPTFWEREPFAWEGGDGRVTRFVSLGAFGGAPPAGKKQRWFYAFSISSKPAANSARPSNVTANPFLEPVARGPKRSFGTSEGDNFIFGNVQQPVKRVRVAQGEPGKPPPGYKCRRCESTEHFINDCPERAKPPEGYVCKLCNEPGHFVRDCPTRDAVGDTGGRKPKPGYVCRACGSEEHYIEDCLAVRQPSGGEKRSGRRGPPKEIAPDECWFCLSNPNLAKHLIVSIGSEVYVTLPKGQIIPTQSAADHVDVPGGGHVLIVPITHYPTFTVIPPDLAPPIIEETDKYKSALRAFFAKHGCSIVLFEVGRLSAKGGHAHVQAVPIPRKLEDQVESTFILEGRNSGIDFEADPEEAMNLCASGRGGYFKVDLPDGRKMVHLIRDHAPFNLQFGRQVLVSLLGVQNRIDWKACMLSEEEDRADAQAFKAAFAPFDPSL